MIGLDPKPATLTLTSNCVNSILHELRRRYFLRHVVVGRVDSAAELMLVEGAEFISSEACDEL